jgi:phosphoglycolate phosphatase
VFDLFDGIACYDDVLQGKPHPDMLYKLLDESNFKEDEVLFIGDGPRDEMAAKEAKMDYIMVDWGFTDHADAVCTVEELKGLLLDV